jgi:hypothetical protein
MAPSRKSHKSRYAAHLDAAIAAAGNPVERRCREAERAALWARQGQLEPARTAIDALRGEAALQPLPLADAWLAWAEGVVTYYGSLDHDAAQQLEAAHQGARTLMRTQPAVRPLAALTAAWLALHSFTRGQPQQLAALLREAFDLSDEQHHAARARAGLAAAFAYHFAGRAEQAQPWHDLSRRHGLALGDEAHLSALMHNQAALRNNQARLAHLLGQSDKQQALAHDIAQALMVAESVDRFDDGIGTAALRSLVPMLRAQMFTAQGAWEDALAVFDAHLDQALQEGMGEQAPCLHADAAWCAWQLQRGPRCDAAVSAALAALANPCEPDDRAMALARLAQVAQARGQQDTAERWRSEADAALQAHRAHQQALCSALDAALGDIGPALFAAR